MSVDTKLPLEADLLRAAEEWGKDSPQVQDLLREHPALVPAWQEIAELSDLLDQCFREPPAETIEWPAKTVRVVKRFENATTLLRNLLPSMTSAAPTVCPHCEVPAPRGSTGMRSSRAMASAARTSSSLLGTTTPIGSI